MIGLKNRSNRDAYIFMSSAATSAMSNISGGADVGDSGTSTFIVSPVQTTISAAISSDGLQDSLTFTLRSGVFKDVPPAGDDDDGLAKLELAGMRFERRESIFGLEPLTGRFPAPLESLDRGREGGPILAKPVI